ncbi:MAG: diaminopimelate epimerase [Thermotogae bacterium]|nr:diaminopimelate epimerase [Thermotogota bacterium]RKX45187.1 MAG: diaminopimelate epimerase [Thermotogota bacterium]
MKITRYSATGNTFVFLDLKHPLSDEEKSELVLQHVGNLDGAIFVEEKNGKPVMDYFNRDGKRAKFCGNGARAFVWHLVTRKGSKREVEFLTGAGMIRGFVKEATAFIQVPDPTDGDLFELENLRIAKIVVGVPHLVIEHPELEKIDLVRLVRPLRWRFDANVNLFREVEKGVVKMRTYERGVERETLACGSGAVAVAHVYRHWKALGEIEEIKLLPPGGELLVLIKDGHYYLGGGVESV